MVVSQIETEELLQSDSLYYHSQISKIVQQIQPQLDKTIKLHMAFHLFFMGLECLEVILFVIFFGYLAQSSLLAVSISLIFLTFFSYFMLRLYLQTKKSEQLRRIFSTFENVCKKLIHYQEGNPEQHIVLANAFTKWGSALQRREFSYFRPPKWLDVVAPSMERWSCFWFFDDVLLMRELLYTGSIEEHIKLVKCEPTSLDVHAALANAYIILSTLYSKQENEGKDEALENKFRKTAERAIEEFKILNDFAPDDPWVHVQLAYSYHDLQMPEEEMREYETILNLRPDDKETLFKLGVLYFQQGYNARGLRVYEALKRMDYQQAEILIEYYGDCKVSDSNSKS